MTTNNSNLFKHRFDTEDLAKEDEDEICLAAYEAALREIEKIEAEKQNEQSNKPQEPLQ
jgi:hypothetical protein